MARKSRNHDDDLLNEMTATVELDIDDVLEEIEDEEESDDELEDDGFDDDEITSDEISDEIDDEPSDDELAEIEEPEQSEPTPKSKRGRSKKQPEPEPDDEDELEHVDCAQANGFDVLEVPVEQIDCEKFATRPIDNARVNEMAKSIRANGLLNPVLVTDDLYCVAGRHRIEAYKKLGRANIPCRVLCDPKSGDPLSSDSPIHVVKGAAATENIVRSQLSPTEESALYNDMLPSFGGEQKKLANYIGVPASRVSRAIARHNDATSALKEALDAGEITIRAADTIISAAETPHEQREMLAALKSLSAGKKITHHEVKQQTSGKPKDRSKGGRKVSRVPVSPQALQTDRTQTTGFVSKTSDGSRLITLTVTIPVTGKTLARVNILSEITKQWKCLDMGLVAGELENCSQQLTD